MKNKTHHLFLEIIDFYPTRKTTHSLNRADTFLLIPGIGGLKHYLKVENIYSKYSVYNRILKLFACPKNRNYNLGQCFHLIQDLSMPHHLNKGMFLTHLQFEEKLQRYLVKHFKDIKDKYNKNYLKKELNYLEDWKIEDLIINLANNTLLNKNIDKELIIFNALYSSERLAILWELKHGNMGTN